MKAKEAFKDHPEIIKKIQTEEKAIKFYGEMINERQKDIDLSNDAIFGWKAHIAACEKRINDIINEESKQ